MGDLAVCGARLRGGAGQPHGPCFPQMHTDVGEGPSCSGHCDAERVLGIPESLFSEWVKFALPILLTDQPPFVRKAKVNCP